MSISFLVGGLQLVDVGSASTAMCPAGVREGTWADGVEHGNSACSGCWAVQELRPCRAVAGCRPGAGAGGAGSTSAGYR